MKQKIINRRNILNTIFYLGYVIFLFFVFTRHENWFDEAQSFLLAKLPIKELFTVLKSEGHPITWYLILKGYILLGFKYEYVGIIAVIFSSISAFIILKKSKLNIFINYLILLCPMFLFYSGVIARSYSLILLLMTILTFIYKDREKHYLSYGIILFLLLNTHVIMLGFVASLSLIDLYNALFKNKYISKDLFISYLIVLIGLFFLLIQLTGSLDSNILVTNNKFSFNLLYLTLRSIGYGCFYYTNLVDIGLIMFGVIIIYLIHKKEDELLFIYLFSFMFLIIIFSLLWQYSAHMTPGILSIIIFILINMYHKLNTKKEKIVLSIIIILLFTPMLVTSYKLVKRDVTSEFSGSKMAAKYVRSYIKEDNNLYCYTAVDCLSIIPYLPNYNFYKLGTHEKIEYVNWNDKNLYNYNFDIENLNKYKVNYVIEDDIRTQIDSRVIYRNKKTYIKENYIVRKVIR